MTEINIYHASSPLSADDLREIDEKFTYAMFALKDGEQPPRPHASTLVFIAKRLRAEVARLRATADASLAYLPPNLDGCDWVWEDKLGHSVQISAPGQILTGDDEWVSLSPEQWGELARVAIYMRDADIDPTVWKD